MLNELVPYIILAVYNVLMLGPLCIDTYRTPRDLFIGLSSVGLLVYGGLWGASFNISVGMLGILAALMVWWMLCALQSPRPRQAITNTIPLVSMVVVCLHLTYSLGGFMFLVASAVVSGVYGVAQTRGHDLFWGGSRPTQCLGTMGNPILHGGFLMIGVFMAALLSAQHHLAWLVVVAFLVGCIWLTKSRGVFLGCLAGTFVLAIKAQSWLAWTVLAFVLIVGTIALRTYRPELFQLLTAQERRNHWKVAFAQILSKPFFGLGADMFGVRVPFVQRDLNNRTNGRFLLRENYDSPWPIRTHNELLQWAVEWGVVGALGMVVVIEQAVLGVPNVYVLAGLVAMLVSGLTFHFHVMHPTNGMFWALLVLSLSSPAGAYVPSPSGLLGFAMLMFLLVLRFTFNEFCFQVSYSSFMRHLRKKAPPIHPLRWNPDSTSARIEACLFWARQGKPWQVLVHGSHALAHYDGTQKIWEIWNIIGVAFMMTKQFEAAETCFARALTFLPSFVSARQNLENLKNIQLGVIR